MATTMSNALQLRAIDVGFDLRAVNMIAAVDLDQEYDGCTYDSRRKPGSERVPEHLSAPIWDAALIGELTHLEGYRLRWVWPSHQAQLRDYAARIVVLPTGEPVLQLRAEDGSRYQYLARDGVLSSRHLPSRGTRWANEPGPPWWEPVQLQTVGMPGLLGDWYRACTSADLAARALQYVLATERVVAWTPNGRQVRYDERGAIVCQTRGDNSWLSYPSLEAVRVAWYAAGGRP